MSKTDEHFVNRWANELSTKFQTSKPDEHIFFRWASQTSTFFSGEQIWMSKIYFQIFYFDVSTYRHFGGSTNLNGLGREKIESLRTCSTNFSKFKPLYCSVVLKKNNWILRGILKKWRQYCKCNLHSLQARESGWFIIAY